MGYRVAVVGATGAVGHEMLSILSERKFAIDEIHALASNRSEGKEINFGEKTIKVRNLDNFVFGMGIYIVFYKGFIAFYVCWMGIYYMFCGHFGNFVKSTTIYTGKSGSPVL